jgi:hypothetical protein
MQVVDIYVDAFLLIFGAVQVPPPYSTYKLNDTPYNAYRQDRAAFLLVVHHNAYIMYQIYRRKGAVRAGGREL